MARQTWRATALMSFAACGTILFAASSISLLVWALDDRLRNTLVHDTPTWLVSILIAAVLRRMALRRGLLKSAPLVRLWYPATTVVLTAAVASLSFSFVSYAILQVLLMVTQAVTAVRCAWLLASKTPLDAPAA